MHQSRQGQAVFGVRGSLGAELVVYGPNRPLHSGHYGNWAPNPAEKLAGLLASMKSDDGRVLIEGFYDSVEPLGEAERAALAAVGTRVLTASGNLGSDGRSGISSIFLPTTRRPL